MALLMAEHRLSQRHAYKLLEVGPLSRRTVTSPARIRNASASAALVEAGSAATAVWISAAMGDADHAARTSKPASDVCTGCTAKKGLTVRRLKRKRLKGIAPSNADDLLRPNQEWALDFVSDAFSNGRALRALTMVDGYTRECPAIEVDTGISSRQVTRTLRNA